MPQAVSGMSPALLLSSAVLIVLTAPCFMHSFGTALRAFHLLMFLCRRKTHDIDAETGVLVTCPKAHLTDFKTPHTCVLPGTVLGTWDTFICKTRMTPSLRGIYSPG